MRSDESHPRRATIFRCRGFFQWQILRVAEMHVDNPIPAGLRYRRNRRVWIVMPVPRVKQQPDIRSACDAQKRDVRHSPDDTRSAGTASRKCCGEINSNASRTPCCAARLPISVNRFCRIDRISRPGVSYVGGTQVAMGGQPIAEASRVCSDRAGSSCASKVPSSLRNSVGSPHAPGRTLCCASRSLVAGTPNSRTASRSTSTAA